jgi:hypothetical protein
MLIFIEILLIFFATLVKLKTCIMATKKINNFVKILLKKRKKIININELKKLFKNYDKTLSDTKVYKIIYYLKNR